MTDPTESHTQQQRRALKILSVATSTALLSLILSVRSHAAVTEVWVARYNNVVSNANGMSSKIVRDAAGDIIVAGDAMNGVTGKDMLTIKYSGATGAVLWQRRYNGPANGDDIAQDLTLDSQGNVLAAGTSQRSDPSPNYYIAKYASTNGALLWERRFHDPRMDSSVGVTALRVDVNDNVVVCGTSITFKLAAGDGALLWSKKNNFGPDKGYNFTPVGVAFGPDGMIAVAGTTTAINVPSISIASIGAWDATTIIFREIPQVAISLGANGIRLRCFGVPARVHQVWRSQSLTGRGSLVYQQAMAPAGVFEFTDISSPAGAAFYHLETLP